MDNQEILTASERELWRHNMSEEDAETVENLSPAQLEYAYRIQGRRHRMAEAEKRAAINPNYVPSRLVETDFRNMAIMFEKRAIDCDSADETWDRVVDDALAASRKRQAMKNRPKM